MQAPEDWRRTHLSMRKAWLNLRLRTGLGLPIFQTTPSGKRGVFLPLKRNRTALESGEKDQQWEDEEHGAGREPPSPLPVGWVCPPPHFI